MRKALSLFFLSSFFYSIAQVDMGYPMSAGRGGVATAFNYNWESIGINPGNLGWEKNETLSIGVLGYGLSLHSEALDLGDLWQAFLRPKNEFSENEKQMFAGLFASQNGLNLTANKNWMSISAQSEKLGGLAISLSDKKLAHIGLNEYLVDIIFNGQNSDVFQDPILMGSTISSLFSGTEVGYLHYRSLNLSYGRKILSIGREDKKILEIFGGVGLKRIWGLGLLEYTTFGDEFVFRSSFSDNYGIDYGIISDFSSSNISGLFNGTGNGYALDIGGSVVIGKKIILAASIIDLGKITWNKNLLEAEDATLQENPDPSLFSGINSFNLESYSEQLFSENSIFYFNPSKADYETYLPSTMRFGASVSISKKIIVGADLVIPLNGKNVNSQKAYYAAAAEINLFGTLKLSTGFGGNNTFGYSFPLGVSFGVFGVTEIQFGTSDLFTLLGRNQNPHLSMAFSALRFNFF